MGITSPHVCKIMAIAYWAHCGQSPLQWRHNERNGVSNHWRLQCLLDCRSRRRSKKTSKLRVTGLCAGNSPLTCEFPAQKASNAENVSIWWRHHVDHWCGPHNLCTVCLAYHSYYKLNEILWPLNWCARLKCMVGHGQKEWVFISISLRPYG